MTDIAIVGKGPAGWSCAMTARMRGLSVKVIAPLNDTGLLRSAERVDNYPGMPQTSGAEMLDSFREQALSLGAEEMFGLVRQIMPMGDQFMLLVENDVLEAQAKEAVAAQLEGKTIRKVIVVKNKLVNIVAN